MLALLLALAASGKVVYATAHTAYLDAGAREGLAAEGKVQLLRGGKPWGTCRIEAVADHHASCVAQGAQPGDAFALPPARKPPAPPPRPQPLPAKELAKQGVLLAAAALPPVEFKAEPGAQRKQVIEARIKQYVWASSTAKPWSQERVDARAAGAPVGAGLTMSADLSARYWSDRFAPVVARPDDRTQLYVWEAAVRRDAPGVAFALGRLRPSFAPGVTPIDGAQAGFRSKGGNEAGFYGGAVPDAQTLAPSTSAGTAGAYWRVQTGDNVFLRHEARVAFVTTPELGKRVEAEGVGQVGLGRSLDLAADVRVGAGDHAGLDAARFDLYARPLAHLSLGASFRYLGLSMPERDGPGLIGTGGASRHGDASASWEAADWIVVSARAGGDQDLVTTLSRAWAGPEVALPILFGKAGGVSAGYQLEKGLDRGGTTWLQASLRSPAWLRLTATGSWSYTRDGALTGDEFGLAFGAAADLTRNVALRLSMLSRLSGKSGPLDTGLAGGAFGTAEVAGRF